jgi:hypothetical protein
MRGVYLVQNETESNSVVFFMKKPDRELSFDEILKGSFLLYKTKIREFVIPFIIIGLISGTLSILTDFGSFTSIDPNSTSPSNFFSSLISSVAVLGIFSWIATSIANAIIIQSTSDILEKGESNPRKSFDLAISRIWSLLGVAIITGLIVILGFICLIVPGIIFAIMFSITVPVIMIEHVGVMESLGRSRKLVGNRWKRVFAVFLLVILVQAVAYSVSNTISSPFGSFSGIISSVVSGLVQPLFPIALTYIYYSMKEKEKKRTVNFCSNCGHTISLESKFCAYCGKEVKEEKLDTNKLYNKLLNYWR